MLTQQVTIAFVDPQPLNEVVSWLTSRYGTQNVVIGQGAHINSVPLGTIMVTPKAPPR